MDFDNHNIVNNNIMNRTFEKKNISFEQENKFNSQILNNNDVKAQTLSLFGINKDNLLDLNDNSISNSDFLIKQPQFELENIYRERLTSLYKNKSKEELLKYFIESEINNILLKKEIEKNKLNKFKLENKLIDIQQENTMLKTKIKNLINNNNNEENYIKYNINKKQNDDNDNNLSLPNSSFVQKELNIQTEYNNMDIDGLMITDNKKY